jgi:uncharacterized protein (DUF305 family)
VSFKGAATAALAALALAGCGGDEAAREPARASAPDRAFVQRLYQQQQVGAELVRSVDGRLRTAAVKRLVKPMGELRERGLARLDPLRAPVEAPGELADLGVTREAAAEDIRATALEGVRPLEPAFLATMARHDQGAIALARAELEHGADPKVKAAARAVVTEYASELAELNRAIAALQQTA